MDHIPIRLERRVKQWQRKPTETGSPLFTFSGNGSDPIAQRRYESAGLCSANRQISAELQRLKSRMSVYMYTDGGEEKPKVQIERVKTEGKGSLWRINLPILEKGKQVGHALMGQKVTREKPEGFLRQTNPKIPFTSYRPSWTDATFAPKIVSRERFRAMRRINGRPVNPISNGRNQNG